jgi:micrococcal nuclease
MIAGPEPLVSIPPGGGSHPSRRLAATLHLPFKYKAFVLAVLIVCVTSAGARAEDFKVVRVVDGDTITILDHGEKVRVRLVGIDAPETSRSKLDPGQPYSQKSKKHLAGLVLNKAVAVKSYGRGRYGRIIGEVFLGNVNVNLEIVEAGLAEVYQGRPPKGLDTGKYRRAEEAAKRGGRNIWSLGSKYVSPKEWRRRK